MILVFIILSSIHLVLDSPLIDPTGNLHKVLFYVDISLTLIFVIEGILKIIAFGFIFNGKESYIRNAWNIIDFVIILLSVSNLII